MEAWDEITRNNFKLEEHLSGTKPKFKDILNSIKQLNTTVFINVNILQQYNVLDQSKLLALVNAYALFYIPLVRNTPMGPMLLGILISTSMEMVQNTTQLYVSTSIESGNHTHH